MSTQTTVTTKAAATPTTTTKRRRGWAKVSPVRDEILRLYRTEKMAYRNVAATLGVTEYEVRRELGALRSQSESQRLAHSPQPKRLPTKPAPLFDRMEMVRLRDAGLSYDRIAVRLRCHRNTVINAFRDMGLIPPRHGRGRGHRAAAAQRKAA